MALSQAIAYDKTLIHEKTKVIGLQGNPAGRLLVQQDSQFYACRPTTNQVPHQEFTGYPGLHQRFNQQHVLVVYINFRAEKNLSRAGIGVVKLRLYELAYNRACKFADQISHENKAIFHDSDHMNGPALEILRDLPGHLLHTLPDLLSGEKHSRIFSLDAAHIRPRSHSFISSISSIRTASPDWTANAWATGNPLIQTISPALSITGHSFRSVEENLAPKRLGCSSSFTFFGD